LEAVRGLAIPHHFSEAAQVVTISLGVASREADGPEGKAASDLLALADAKLYQAKHEGRARACGARLNDEPR
jgi:PleD family two-component response regulator